MNKTDRDAIIEIKIKSDSGYQSDENHNISLDQWERISSILNEPVYVQQFGRGDREAPMQLFLQHFELEEAVKNYVSAKYNTQANNIEATDDGVTYEC